ncbi:MAG: hypothetical protein UY08_C0007G0014 [Candidatus Gottesmanbacteria bacterium GW2011_GWA1_47_8]|uniref:Uncharacterized protein n=1 Tax=Candidatus Gottesmanbacteria bacterium GW2011_GWA1_47_8 TaxID=1618438 RepID=A0A0G1TGJ5_9BACT|nr:MAG: hypothetical protein UY08_C0007G0014 [Candidatus Gottesmanbacteria bacterium GW2011_GWA1_47_8]
MNIVFSLLLMLATVAGGSIIWPKFSNQPRPEPLEQIHNVVKDTSLGKSFATILGVSSQSAEPLLCKPAESP